MVVRFQQKEFHVRTAESFGTRFKGLMGEQSLPAGEGMLLENCGAIHCCFMRFPIDVIYLDKNRKVVGKETVAPWRAGKILRGVKSVLEVNKGEASDIAIGEEMVVDL